MHIFVYRFREICIDSEKTNETYIQMLSLIYFWKKASVQFALVSELQ